MEEEDVEEGRGYSVVPLLAFYFTHVLRTGTQLVVATTWRSGGLQRWRRVVRVVDENSQKGERVVACRRQSVLADLGDRVFIDGVVYYLKK